MNICFVYKHFPLDANFDSGIGRYLSELTEELSKNHKITILTTSEKPRVIKSGNITVYAISYPRIKNRTITFLLHLIRIARLLPKITRKNKIQIIEFANWESEGLFFSIFINKFLKIPTVIRLHTPSLIDYKILKGPKYFSEKLKVLCEKIFVNQKENHLTTSTNFNAKECSKIYNLKNKHIEIIPLGIKPKTFLKKVTPTTPPAGGSLTTVLFVGRLEKRKGIDTLIEAVPRVLKRTKNVQFLIVGRENNNIEWLIKLRSSIPYKFLGKVIFMGYIENPRTLDMLYKNSDICVIPSRYESFGISVLDALSYGKATIAGNTGGIRNIIRNKKNGLLIPPANSKALADSILYLIKNERTRITIGKNAREEAINRYSSILMTRNTVNFYESLAGGK